MSPAVRAWLGQRSTIQGIAILVGATVAFLTGKLGLDLYEAALASAFTLIGLPEATHAAITVAPPAEIEVKTPGG